MFYVQLVLTSPMQTPEVAGCGVAGLRNASWLTTIQSINGSFMRLICMNDVIKSDNEGI